MLRSLTITLLFLSAYLSVSSWARSMPQTFSPETSSADPWEGRWGYAQIVDIIEKAKTKGTPIRKLKDLLKALPDEAKSHFTFVYRTQTVLQGASPLFPRALVFNGRMI